jgi:hypothetical protein
MQDDPLKHTPMCELDRDNRLDRSLPSAVTEEIERKDAEIARLQLQWTGMKDEVNLCHAEIARLRARVCMYCGRREECDRYGYLV